MDPVALDGGLDTVRVSESESARRARADSAAAARGNLAAMLVDGYGGVDAVRADPVLAAEVAAVFVELCDALGLDAAPATAPGVCRRPGCGQVLPMSTAASGNMAGSARVWRRKGFCSRGCAAGGG